MSRRLRVSELADVSGVSVRTLHYYDEIGLLVPQGRSGSGYRIYGDEEVMRLQQILIRREFGFSLADIRAGLDDPAFDQRQALVEQRARLECERKRQDDMIQSIDAALAALEEKEINVNTKQIFEGFDNRKHEQEVQERWGDTEAYRVSSRRVKDYSESDWREIRDEEAAVYRDAARLMSANESPDSDAAMDVAERHRMSIDRWYYPCSHRMHAGLADMWEADSRFAANIDQHGAGLTAFLAAAARANALRH